MIKRARFFIGAVLCLALLASAFLSVAPAYAADGSGSLGSLSGSFQAGSNGNTAQFVFTAAEAMKDGGIKVTVPSGWTAPQGSSGTAGYVTASTTGVFSRVENNLDSDSGWDVSNVLIGLSANSSVKKEGSASLNASGILGTGRAYYDYGSGQDWSGVTKVGFWFRSSSVLPLGSVKFRLSESTGVPTGGTTISYNLPAVSANTWTYVTIDLTGDAGSTRNAVRSYGFDIPTGIGVNYNFDNFQLGSPNMASAISYSGQTIEAKLMELPSSGTVMVTYGANGGTSGFTVPTTVGTGSVTGQSKVDSDGTYTSLASGPSLTINPGAVASVGISTSTANIPAGGTMTPPFALTAQDSYGNVVTTDNTTLITASIASGPSGATLSGTTSVALAGGIATFDNLSVDKLGSGYSFAFSAPGLATSTSGSFTSYGATTTITSTSTLVVEGAYGDTYFLALSAAPSSSVTVTITPDSQLTVSTSTFTFTTSNWNTPKPISAFAVDDTDEEGAHTGVVTHTLSSSDARFNGGRSTQLVDIVDNEVALVPSTLSFVNTYDNYLSGKPITPAMQVAVLDQFGNVLTSDDTTEVTISAASLPPEGGSLAGDLTVTAVDGIATFTDLTPMGVGDDYILEATAPGLVTGTSENKSAWGVKILRTSSPDDYLQVFEGDTGPTMEFYLMAEPTAPVYMTIAPNAEFSVDEDEFEFNYETWSNLQQFTVSGISDEDDEGVTDGFLTFTITSEDERFNGTYVRPIGVSVFDAM